MHCSLLDRSVSQRQESRVAGEMSPSGVLPEAKSTIETKMSLYGARCDWSSASDFCAHDCFGSPATHPHSFPPRLEIPGPGRAVLGAEAAEG